MYKQAGVFVLSPALLLVTLWVWTAQGQRQEELAPGPVESLFGEWLAAQDQRMGEYLNDRESRAAFLIHLDQVMTEVVQGNMSLREGSERVLAFARDNYPRYLRFLPLVESAPTSLARVAHNLYRHFREGLQGGEYGSHFAVRLPEWERELGSLEGSQP